MPLKLVHRLPKHHSIFHQRYLTTSTSRCRHDFLQISNEVSDALNCQRPVVALESTIITHGMPYPQNYETALSVEECVRKAGAVPATIAVLKGKICVGLTKNEIQFLSEPQDGLLKVSRRDFAWALSQRLSGGTTVSGTMIAAHMAGVPIFATGGIGGVHRGAETSFDVSADLTELGRTPVTVVSAGVKSILDIDKTLEYLETQGVTVATFGNSRNFPAFFTKDSGFLSPLNVKTSQEAAKIIDANATLNLGSGVLIAVPISEEDGALGLTIQNAIDDALESARQKCIKGKDVTPYVLEQVNKLTAGESLKANIALVKNNARVAAGIAVCLSKLRAAKSCDQQSAFTERSAKSSDKKSPVTQRSASSIRTSSKVTGRPVVLGATINDIGVKVNDEKFMPDGGGTYAGRIMQSFGGVGRNLADCLTRMDVDPVFVSVVGGDAGGASFFANCNHMDLSSVKQIPQAATASYIPILKPNGQLLFGVGDFDIVDLADTVLLENVNAALTHSTPIVVIDANFSAELIEQVVMRCANQGVPVMYEPTEPHLKCKKPFHTEAWKHLNFITPNLAEAVEMWKSLRQNLGQDDHLSLEITEDTSSSDLIRMCLPVCYDLTQHIPCVLLTLGPHGVLLCHRHPHSEKLTLSQLFSSEKRDHFTAVYYPELNESSDLSGVVSVSGAGDCLASAFLASLMQGVDLSECIQQGMAAAWLSLHAQATVPETISPSVVQNCAKNSTKHDWRPLLVS